MKRNSRQVVGLLCLAMLAGIPDSGLSQNPLRTFDQPVPHDATQVAPVLQIPQQKIHQDSQNNTLSAGENAIHDSNVAPAVFSQPDQPATTGPLQNPLLARANGAKNETNLMDAVSKIAINLVFVLCFALGVLLLAKKYLKPNSDTSLATTSTSNDTVTSDALQVKHKLLLDAKTSIQIVQWRTNRFMVACDQTGIQSVHPLNASFDQTLSELDEEKLDGRVLRMLLNEMESKAA